MSYVPEQFTSRQAAERHVEAIDERGEAWDGERDYFALYATRPELRRVQQKSYRASGRPAVFRKIGSRGR